MRQKIGVYICHCGGNISDYVDVNKVKDLISAEEGVNVIKTTMLACADSSQKEMVEDIKNKGLDAIVVASCSPKLHLTTFRAVSERAGLNPYNYVQVNIREQGSWAHSDTPQQATEKVVRLVRGGIARVRHSEPLSPIQISARNSVAIFGAGISGLKSAIEIADMGSEVYLIEQDHFIGGRVPQWGDLFPTDENGEEIVERLFEEIDRRKNITLLTGAEAESVSGCVGSFDITLKIHPRYVKSGCDTDKLKEAIDACPVEVADEFNFAITQRKAIYKSYPGALPDIPAIDMKACNKCGECAKICGKSVDLTQKQETRHLEVGAILLHTGFDPYQPAEGEFGYKQNEQVITLQEFRRLIQLSGDELTVKGRRIKEVAFIYCVGTRQKEGENKYCARFCCTAAIHTALLIKNRFRDIQNYHLFRDIRTYGKQEILYEKSGRQQDLYLKFPDDEPPTVEQEGDRTVITVKDILTDGEELEIAADLVVLVTGMVPRSDNKIADILKVPHSRDNFFNEIHPKLRPVETVIGGVFIAGTCQGPKNIAETVMSSLSASAKAHSLIQSGEIELEPLVATVNTEVCKWCGQCAEVCTYGAISQEEVDGKTVALVSEALCKGCGSCAAMCPLDAIDVIGYTSNEIEATIDALTREVNL
jgi:heterodisulfide reductase subunit A